MRRIKIETTPAYEVLLGPDLLSGVGSLLLREGVEPGRLALITDTTVGRLYAGPVANSLTAAGFEVYKCLFLAGEGAKTFPTLGYIVEMLAAAQLRRSDTVVALGGGVVSDLAGFASAIYLRGLPLVQIPTTLLAMVDASVGGKNGVNLTAGKNMAGSFHQPRLVLGDINVLAGQSDEQFAQGMAEAVKCGMIADAELLQRITEYKRGGAGLTDIIAGCLRVKGDLVARDEYDRRERHLLNFGHTPAHAIEQRSDFNIAHGRAVAMGMMMITRAAVRRGLATPECMPALTAALTAQGLDFACPYDAAELAAIARLDKKRDGDLLRLVIPQTPGRCRIHTIYIAELEGWLADGLEGGLL